MNPKETEKGTLAPNIWWKKSNVTILWLLNTFVVRGQEHVPISSTLSLLLTILQTKNLMSPVGSIQQKHFPLQSTLTSVQCFAPQTNHSVLWWPWAGMLERVEIIIARVYAGGQVSAVNAASQLTFQWPAEHTTAQSRGPFFAWGPITGEKCRKSEQDGKKKHVLPRELLRQKTTIKQPERGRHDERRTREAVRRITGSLQKKEECVGACVCWFKWSGCLEQSWTAFEPQYWTQPQHTARMLQLQRCCTAFTSPLADHSSDISLSVVQSKLIMSKYAKPNMHAPTHIQTIAHRNL